MISWDKTKDILGFDESTITGRNWVIVTCDRCGCELKRKYNSYKQIIKSSGKYYCHKCAVANHEFRDGCSVRAKQLWRNDDYRAANLSVVRSDDYREKKRKESIVRWRDNEYRRKMLTDDKRVARQAQTRQLAKEFWNKSEYRAKMKSVLGKRAKRLWASQDYRDKMKPIQSQNSKRMWMNKREMLMRSFRSDKFLNLMHDVAIEINSRSNVKQKQSESSKCLWKNEKFRRHMLEVLNSPEYKQRQRENHPIIKRSETELIAQRDKFVQLSIHAHPYDEYDYSQVEYIDSKKQVKIVCPKHGAFYQTPNNHLKGNRCPFCASTYSRSHLELADFVRSLTNDVVLINNRSAIHPYELDIFVPSSMFAVEYNGLFWHSYGDVESTTERMRHAIKVDACVDAGVRLMMIREDEWKCRPDLVKSMIMVRLNKIVNKIYARNCEIMDISYPEYESFTNQHHMQGCCSAMIRYGLKYQGDLVSIMSFNGHPRHEWEIIRFANIPNNIIIGGASRLFSHFIKTINPSNILTYADRRYSDGNLYRKLGFVLDGITRPNYVYIKNGEVFSRQHFQKHKLPSLLETFDPGRTEAENMFVNGYRRLWDAGHYRFIWHNK